MSPAGRGYTYQKAQPGSDENYHIYAAGLNGITGAYGFGLQDRNGATLINFNRVDQPNAYLEVGIDTEGQSAVLPSPTQDAGVTIKVSDFVPKQLTPVEINSQYGLNNFTTHTSICSFNATITPQGSYGTFMIDTNAIPTGPVNGLTFMKFYSNGSSAKYKTYASGGPQYSDGVWWITDLAGNHKTLTDQLTKGEHYYIHFVIKDNGEYDEDSTLGNITDPVALGSSSSGGTGCTVNPGTTLSYELTIFLIMTLALLCMRKFYFRRE
ncbi:hypothetical protein [Maridesulfovibrio zosterae]|uniref:hypothetical protein n=1 Tax=Maridesulfovibrio zosterae TaxID=82171 RepID=UPI00041472B5|nr:hypothetical protein [Maridesulfovibrio zosterae]